MIEEQAVVIKKEGRYVWVHTQRQSSCGHCTLKNGCGTQVLSKVLGNKTTSVRCLNSIGSSIDQAELKSGDRVLIAVQESALLRASFLMYLLPLIVMILCSGTAVSIARVYWPEWLDLVAVITAFSGFFAGLYFSRNITQKKSLKYRFEPEVIKRYSAHEAVCKPLSPVSGEQSV